MKNYIHLDEYFPSSLSSVQATLLHKVSSIEKDLQGFEEFPSNKEILEAGTHPDPLNSNHTLTTNEVQSTTNEAQLTSNEAHGDGPSPRRSVTPGSMLNSTWVGRKNSKRIQAAEDGIEKLFSLMDEVITSNKELKQFLDEHVVEHDQLKEKVNMLDIDVVQKELNECKETINNNSNSVKDCLKQTSSNTTNLQNLQKLVDDYMGSSNNNINSDELSKLKDEIDKLKNESVELSQRCALNSDDIAKLQESDNSVILGELSERVDLLTSDLNTAVVQLSDKIKSLEESLSNMNNKELSSILENIEALKLMSKDLDELRKLQDLKDLADNVSSMDKVRGDLDLALSKLQEIEEWRSRGLLPDDIDRLGHLGIVDGYVTCSQFEKALKDIYECEKPDVKEAWNHPTDGNKVCKYQI